jgi:hypothetical protein
MSYLACESEEVLTFIKSLNKYISYTDSTVNFLSQWQLYIPFAFHFSVTVCQLILIGKNKHPI